MLAGAMSAAAYVPVSGAKGVDASVVTAFRNQVPGVTGMGPIVINKAVADAKTKTITVEANINASYLPVTTESLRQLKDDIRAAFGPACAKYKVKIYSIEKNKDGSDRYRKDFDSLALFQGKKNIGPKEKNAFVRDLNAQPAPKGLDGKNIAVWQSHGWYFEPKLNRWEWQRARIFQTVEDLYTQGYVMPFLMPMLENAGAYVMSPRERDCNDVEIIVDNDGGLAKGKYDEQGTWETVEGPGFAYTTAEIRDVDNPFKAGTARTAKTARKAKDAPTATWTADFPEGGTYAVYVSYQTLPNSAPDALYRVNSKSGTRQFKINQNMGGGTWIYLGHFDFDKGTPDKPVVELVGVSDHSGKAVSADAVKIGGGMGNVARKVKNGESDIDYQYITSKYPRFVEGARYFLQWAGAPDSVYTPSNNANDYTDDYRSRGEWVNWLAGGSSMLPQRKGLNIPVDLSFAFHSDAGTTMNDSIIGTLGIYSSEGRVYGDKTANGSDRMVSHDLTDAVVTNIVNDIRAKYEPNWTRRGMWDETYFEARVPEVPAMLLELLSHQNFADMKYGLDPEFRFLVSRAIYKGMLQFLANRDGRPYVVTPLAVRNFAIAATDSNGAYRLTWQPTVDSLESTAKATYYLVEERIGDGGFRQIAKVTEPAYDVRVSDNDIHSYRIIAGNDGGVSFPGEVLALCYKPGAPVVNIVNGFTRVSAPDWFDSGDIAGFYDERDGGVPYVKDISYIGPTFEFRRNIPWMDDDAAGFGASRSMYESKVIAGNTFDFVYTHGCAVRDAGYGFVSSSVAAFTETPVSAEPKLVDLILGKQKEIKKGRGVYGTYYKTFPADLQKKITEYTAAGGNIFVSGAYVATDLWDNPNSSEAVAKADQEFATKVLGYHWRVGQASQTGKVIEVPTRYKQLTGGEYSFHNEYNEDCYAVESPDSFYAPDSKTGATFMRYTENNLVAGTVYAPGNYRTLVIGFPFETIKCPKCRAKLMKQILNFLDNK